MLTRDFVVRLMAGVGFMLALAACIALARLAFAPSVPHWEYRCTRSRTLFRAEYVPIAGIGAKIGNGSMVIRSYQQCVERDSVWVTP